MVGAEGVLADVQGPLAVPQGVGDAAAGIEQGAERGQGDGHVGVHRAQVLLLDGEGPLEQRLSVGLLVRRR